MVTAVESLARTLIKEFSTVNAESLERTRVLRRAFSDGAALIHELAFAAGVETVKPATLRRAAESLDLNQRPRQQADRIDRGA